MAIELIYRGKSENKAIGTPVTIYSKLVLSERVVVLGLSPRNLRDNLGGATKQNQSSPGSHIFDQETKKRKNDQTGTQARYLHVSFS